MKPKEELSQTQTNVSRKKIRPEEELSQAQIDEMKEWFYFFDKNGDEKLDIKELDNVFHALCWDLTKDELEEVMKDADTDGNGFLEYDEYMRLLNTYRKDPAIEEVELIQAFGKDPAIEEVELIQAFGYFDKDRNGWLDRDELSRLLMSFGDVYTKRDRKLLDDLITSMDTNGDGKIDIKEFVEAMLKKPH